MAIKKLEIPDDAIFNRGAIWQRGIVIPLVVYWLEGEILFYATIYDDPDIYECSHPEQIVISGYNYGPVFMVPPAYVRMWRMGNEGDKVHKVRMPWGDGR